MSTHPTGISVLWFLSACCAQGAHGIFIQQVFTELLPDEITGHDSGIGTGGQTWRNTRWTPNRLVGGKGRRGMLQAEEQQHVPTNSRNEIRSRIHGVL